MEVSFPFEKLRKIIYLRFIDAELSEEHTEAITDIYIRAALRGVGHSDLS